MPNSNPFAAPWKHNGRTADQWLALAAVHESNGRDANARYCMANALRCEEADRVLNGRNGNNA